MPDDRYAALAREWLTKDIGTRFEEQRIIDSLAALLARGNDLATSSRFANAASALATTKLGAQASLPAYAEVLSLLKKQKAA